MLLTGDKKEKAIVKYPRNLFNVWLNTFYIERLRLLLFALGAPGKSHRGANYKGCQSEDIRNGNHKPNFRTVLS